MSAAEARVGLFIVGAQRCGTTAWFDYLASHPAVVTPPCKEPNFFTTDFPVARRASSVADYHALFGRWPPGAGGLGLDASTSYLFSTEAAAAIHAYNPAARILVLLRPPLAFLPSLHAHLRLRGFENAATLEQAWQLEAARMQGLELPPRCPDPVLLRYRHLARLGEQLARYTALFPAQQIAVMDFEDWRPDPRRAYLALLQFLQLEDDGRHVFPKVNEAAQHRSPLLDRGLRSPHPLAVLLRASLRRLPTGTGRSLLDEVKRLNRAPLQGAGLSERLTSEILHALADDQALLDRLATPLRLLRR